MEIKKHYKLYKDGKRWVTATIATVAASTALLMGGVVHADQGTTNTQTLTNGVSNQLPTANGQAESKAVVPTGNNLGNTPSQNGYVRIIGVNSK